MSDYNLRQAIEVRRDLTESRERESIIAAEISRLRGDVERLDAEQEQRLTWELSARRLLAEPRVGCNCPDRVYGKPNGTCWQCRRDAFLATPDERSVGPAPHTFEELVERVGPLPTGGLAGAGPVAPRPCRHPPGHAEVRAKGLVCTDCGLILGPVAPTRGDGT